MKIYLFKEGQEEATKVEISSDKKITEFIQEFAKEHGITDSIDELTLTTENDSEIITADVFGDSIITDKCNVHIHRCKEITLQIGYNGKFESGNFPPSTTGSHLLIFALKKFSISESVSKWTLRTVTVDGPVIRPEQHIGNFTKYPNCKLTIYLIPAARYQGWD